MYQKWHIFTRFLLPRHSPTGKYKCTFNRITLRGTPWVNELPGFSYSDGKLGIKFKRSTPSYILNLHWFPTLPLSTPLPFSTSRPHSYLPQPHSYLSSFPCNPAPSFSIFLFYWFSRYSIATPKVLLVSEERDFVAYKIHRNSNGIPSVAA